MFYNYSDLSGFPTLPSRLLIPAPHPSLPRIKFTPVRWSDHRVSSCLTSSLYMNFRKLVDRPVPFSPSPHSLLLLPFRPDLPFFGHHFDHHSSWEMMPDPFPISTLISSSLSPELGISPRCWKNSSPLGLLLQLGSVTSYCSFPLLILHKVGAST